MHGDLVSYFRKHTGLVSYFSTHTDQASSFGGCMALVSYLDTARRPVSFLAKKARFVTTSNLIRGCHKADYYGSTPWRCPPSVRLGCDDPYELRYGCWRERIARWSGLMPSVTFRKGFNMFFAAFASPSLAANPSCL